MTPISVWQKWQGVAIGGLLFLLGLGISIGTFSVGALPGQDTLGPRLFPVLIGGGLIILGAVTIWQGRHALRGEVPETEAALIPGSEEGAPSEPGDWPTLLWVLAGMGLATLGYKTIGFIPSAFIAFLLTARGFAGHWSWRHALVGFVVVLVAFFGFTKGLGLGLPTGFLKGILGGH